MDKTNTGIEIIIAIEIEYRSQVLADKRQLKV